MGGHLWVQIWPKFCLCNCCAMCTIVSYIPAIYHGRVIRVIFFKFRSMQWREQQHANISQAFAIFLVEDIFQKKFYFVVILTEGSVMNNITYSLWALAVRDPLGIHRLRWCIQTWWYGVLRNISGYKVLAWCQPKRSSQDASADISRWWVHHVYLPLCLSHTRAWTFCLPCSTRPVCLFCLPTSRASWCRSAVIISDN